MNVTDYSPPIMNKAGATWRSSGFVRDFDAENFWRYGRAHV
jgi:hypothetical protein